MKKKGISKKVKKFLKSGLEELIINIKLFPFYLLLAAVLYFALKYLPDYLITHVKPEYLNESDAVTFYSAIITSLVTLVGILLTLQHNQKMVQDQLEKSEQLTQKQLEKSEEINREIIKQNQEKLEEERRLSVLPYLTINKIGMEEYIAKHSLESEAEEAIKRNYEEQQYYSDYSSLLGFYKLREYPIEEIITYFTNNKVDFLTHLEKNDKDTVQSGPKLVNDKKYYPYLYKPYSLSNSGIGTAVELRIYLYKIKMSEDGNMQSYGVPSMSPAINLSPGQNCKLSFFSNDVNFVETYYRLELQYSDIYKHLYRQEYYIYFEKERNIFMIQTSLGQELVFDYD